MKFLIVDDSSTMRRILINGLKIFGHEHCAEAENGEQALEVFRKGGVDFIITDWNMPVMNGLDFILAVREADPGVPILMITTKVAKDDILQAIKAGANNYMVKPFTPDTLKEKITAMLTNRFSSTN